MHPPQNISQSFNLHENLRIKQLLFFVAIVIFYYIFLYYNGFFQIGWLSDSYEDMYFALNTTVVNIFKGEIYFGRYRPLLFLILKLLHYLNSLLGVEYDNFIFFSIISSLLYLISGVVIYKLLKLLSVNSVISILASLIVLFYPNNIHNLAWSAAFFETISLIIYLFSIYFTVILMKEKNIYLIPLILLMFLLGVLLKETNLTIPFISILFVSLLGYDIKSKESKILFLAEVVILCLYTSLKFFVLRHPITANSTITVDNIYKLIYKIYMSYSVPGDYIEILTKIHNYDFLLLIYIVLFISLIIYIVLQSRLYKKMIIIMLMSLIIVLPNIYAGYIRPQLIFIPFSIIFVSIIIIIHNKLRPAYTIMIQIFFLTIFINYSGFIIKDWKNTFLDMRKKMDLLVSQDHHFSDSDVIIGNTSRIKQCFLFDNPTYIYNYWKYKQISFNDTLNSYFSTVSLYNYQNYVPLEYYYSTDTLVLKVNSNEGYFSDDVNNKLNLSEYEIQNIGRVKIISRNHYNKITGLQIFLKNTNKQIYHINNLEVKKIMPTSSNWRALSN